MAEEPKLPPERLHEAIQEESDRFQQFYTWLERSMPKIFFNEVKREWINFIVHSLMGFQEQDYFSEIHLRNAAISLCIDGPEADVKILKSYPFYGIKNYTTYVSREPLPFADQPGFLRIATLHFTEVRETVSPECPVEIKQELMSYLTARHPNWGGVKCDALIDLVDPTFLRRLPVERRVIALEMYERAETRDHCQYEAQYEEDWEKKGIASMNLVLAWKNAPKHNFLYRLAQVVGRHGLVMRRVNAAYIHPYTTNSVFVLSFGLHGKDKRAAWEAADISDFLQELAMLKYFGSEDLIDKTFVQSGLLKGTLANLLRSVLHFIHQVLVHLDPNLYTPENIEEGLCRHPELTQKLCETFEHKFHPNHNDLPLFRDVRKEYLELVAKIDTGHDDQDERRKNILNQAMNFISHVLKTNFYRTNKTALAYRVDPHYLNEVPFDRSQMFPELPNGIFYFKGMHFLAFHIRFRDLSRGGLRTVYPKKKELVLAERNSVFSECYNLSYTQQKKNKDIPEGGAKGVIFLKPYEHLAAEAEIYANELRICGFEQAQIDRRIDTFMEEQELEYLYQTQRSFIKNFLSLINCNPDGSLRAKYVVDYLKKPEYIYLGPDENMHDSMIEWIANESIKDHYKPAGAFISGKPQIGINHKEFGVTSKSVNVFMHEVLRYLDIDPYSKAFTVKMTGGPDGDVAGNQILNLYRYYPDTAKLLALTDVSGTIYDPTGLDLKVCADLFHEGKSIRFYPPENLSNGGFLLDREKRREPSPYVQQTLCWRKVRGSVETEWLSGNEMNALFRNNVHQTKTDVFIPCGGRPRTLRDTNYQEFLDETNTPTARAIIEGANLYLSPWARKELENLGVLIVKDSSANKGGVICSSFEILCALTLSDKEFMDFKPLLVQEIIDRLQACALDEASLLLRVHSENRIPLSQISDELAKRVNMYTDQLLNYLNGVKLSDSPKDPLIQCFLNYCPRTLREKFQDHLLREIPENHKKAIIASHIAARLVYKRGLYWFPSLVDIFPIILNDKDLYTF